MRKFNTITLRQLSAKPCCNVIVLLCRAETQKVQSLMGTLARTNFKSTRFFLSNTFISNATLKLAKNQAKAKQHPEAELLLFENFSLSSSTLSSENNRRHF